MNRNKHQSKINFNSILEACKKRYTPFDKQIAVNRKPLSMITAIKEAKKAGQSPLIAEVKYRSPTNENREPRGPDKIALEMTAGGACAISVLTEPEFFGGNLENIPLVKKAVPVPVLRKDFLFHPTQIPESYHYGADSILLITSYFTRNALKQMIADSRGYGMEPLVEVHSPLDIETATAAGASLYAVNNRDKDTLEIDLERTKQMAPLIDGVIVSASGVETTDDLKKVLKHADAALVGTSIMKSQDIESKVRELVDA
ncbi:indole-3-glycerol phosphate synthase [archaeon BMS3Abin16]|nr:indole-3-glycerol phosphate synthase [archaeon BMS3Abin16]